MTNSVEKPTSLSRVCSKVAVVGCQSSTWCPQQQENHSNLFLNSTSSFRRVSSALCTRACLHTLIFHSWAIAVFSILTYLLTSYDVSSSLLFQGTRSSLQTINFTFRMNDDFDRKFLIEGNFQWKRELKAEKRPRLSVDVGRWKFKNNSSYSLLTLLCCVRREHVSSVFFSSSSHSHLP